MERKDIVERFLREGRQLDSAALDYFMSKPEKIDEFIKTAQKDTTIQQSTITLDSIMSVLKEKEQPTVKIIKKFCINERNEKISISDYSNQLISNYEMKRQMLINRVDSTKLLSINKIQKQNNFVLICMVRERDQVEKSAIVEDMTGNITIYFEDTEFENLLENDIVAIQCEPSPTGIKAKQIIWPDVPLKRTVNKTKESIHCLFISDFHMDSEQFNREGYEKFLRWIDDFKKHDYGKTYILILGGISQKKSDVKKLFNILPKNSFKIFLRAKKDAVLDRRKDLLCSATPMMIEIEGIKFLLCQKDELYAYKRLFGRRHTDRDEDVTVADVTATDATATDIMINLLKRRDLTPFVESGKVFIPTKGTLIDQVPDIFASGSFHSATATNYKGVTIITTGSLSLTGEPVFWTVDLKTREINKLGFS